MERDITGPWKLIYISRQLYFLVVHLRAVRLDASFGRPLWYYFIIGSFCSGWKRDEGMRNTTYSGALYELSIYTTVPLLSKMWGWCSATKTPIQAGANLLNKPPHPIYSQSVRCSVMRLILLNCRMIRWLNCLISPPSNGHLNQEIYESESALPKATLLGLLDPSLPIRLGYFMFLQKPFLIQRWKGLFSSPPHQFFSTRPRSTEKQKGPWALRTQGTSKSKTRKTGQARVMSVASHAYSRYI